MAKKTAITTKFSTERIRQLGVLLTKRSDFSTREARAVVLLYGKSMEEAMEEAARQFLKAKLTEGNK